MKKSELKARIKELEKQVEALELALDMQRSLTGSITWPAVVTPEPYTRYPGTADPLPPRDTQVWISSEAPIARYVS